MALEGGSMSKEEHYKGVDHYQSLESLKPSDDQVVVNVNPSGPGNEVQNAEEVQDVSHVAEDDSLSIEKKERELIVRALQKNNNKRKYAARDLGISERTLYRKIKQYELEE
jgi:transcriptional regulator with PAS, ATPase and Fis domain